LQKGRVDEITKRRENIQGQGQGKDVGSTEAGDEAGGIRLPPGMRGKENL
jgi:hypothetical protein